MPDRDFAIRAVGRVWGPACRLWVLDGPSDAAVSKTSEALARRLRETRRVKPTEGAGTRSEVEQVTAAQIERVQSILREDLLAPSRRLLAESGLNYEQIDDREREFIKKLGADVTHFARALAAGRTPRRAPKRRPGIESVLARPVKVRL